MLAQYQSTFKEAGYSTNRLSSRSILKFKFRLFIRKLLLSKEKFQMFLLKVE